MKNPTHHNRRHFLQSSLLGSTALAALGMPRTLRAAVTRPERVPDDGLKLGVASYTLRKFSLDQAIAMTKEAGVRYICLKDMHLPLKSSPAECQEARRRIEAAGLTLMGAGVIYMKNDEAEVRGYFEYAKAAGMPTIVCSPDPDALDTVEKFAKQYDIRIAIHNHGPTDKKYPSPLDVLKLIKNRDAHMGTCIDVGHTVRIGQDPVPIIEECASRLYSFHMKDVTEATAKGKPIAVGRGVIDIVAVLKTLLKIKYSYDVALEYEDKADAPMPGICESFGYLHGVLATV
ncbi:MAG TPA: sugar phosphate isomerase/epimerase [Candidatus Acidoferrum sp.]|jgi:inosose dehydratase|nr:sugar phosphate isomerase/epimerase [Candidatus Acidoferrum sp.]